MRIRDALGAEMRKENSVNEYRDVLTVEIREENSVND